MHTHRSVLVLLCAAALASCDKNAVQNIAGPLPGGARVKFFNFGVGTPGVNFYVDAMKVTAIVTAACSPPPTTPPPVLNPACLTTGLESTTGVAQGLAAAGGFYTAITPGEHTLKGTIAAATDKDLAISSVTTTLADGKNYSYIISGIYNTTAKTADAFVVEDPVNPAIDFAVAHVRFVNAISNANPMTLYALNTTAGSTEVAVGAEVAYKGAGAFTALPAGVYDLRTRYTGSGTNVITRTAVSFLAGRVYTITSRGDITIASTTSANRPMLDNTANR